ncbi:endonuclease VII domain-containing protein [Longimycelium tulufanense]|uniref:endonuclease VII domain-containing protein n=1 Tax=Longimycelium tulufanense TaxID=907463 RepID=UPI0035712A0A
MECTVGRVRRCRDCRGGKRPAPYPGPRCATHHRAARAARRRAAHSRHIQRTYGITLDEYERLYEAQGGACAICQRAKGTGRRRLAVDHNHRTGEVRGLLCGPCNRGVLGHLHDDPDALQRAIDYLINPPSRRVLSAK